VTDQVGLGTVEFSEKLIQDLYLGLRARINTWAAVTQQTAQARMGYVGQHLVSVATGFPGGKSGARGKDLILPGGKYAEIKTCYRVDQLGSCATCGQAVASIEAKCTNPACGSTNIVRKDDSKWLIGIRNDDEFGIVMGPDYYYLVLFDFVDLAEPDTIRASIWRVGSASPGFGLCMIDYYMNIRAGSVSKAPFNLWPYSLKFELMKPTLIYRSLIAADDTITTVVFPGRDQEVPSGPPVLSNFVRSTNLTVAKAQATADRLGLQLAATANKLALFKSFDDTVAARGIAAGQVADALANELYRDEVTAHLDSLPPGHKAYAMRVLGIT